MSDLTFLIVDDDPDTLAMLEDIFRTYFSQHQVVACESVKDALAKRDDHAFDIVLSDLKLGDGDGVSLVKELQIQAPESAYLLFSGGAELSDALAAINDVRIEKFLTKPIAIAELVAAVREQIDAIEKKMEIKSTSVLFDAFNKANLAIATLDVSLTVIAASDAAKSIFKEGSALLLTKEGKLVANNSRITKSFAEWLAALKDQDGDSSAQALYRVGRCDDRLPVSVMVLDLARNENSERLYHIVIIDPERRVEIPVSVLVDALEISRSEARVVQALASGSSVEEAAEKCSLSVSSARTYIKNVYSKTGISRQGQLVHRALTAVSW